MSSQFTGVPGRGQGEAGVLQPKAIEEMERQVAKSPNDARSWLFLVSLYTKANRFDDALKAASRVLELSPKKQQIYFVVADIYLSSGQYEKAFEILQKAYELDRTYDEAAKDLAIAAIFADKRDLAEKLLNEPEKNWPVKFGDAEKFINAYARVGNYEEVKKLWQMAIAKDPNNAQLHVSLAATYLQIGDRTNSIKELEKAVELEPKFKEQGEYYINEIKAGRNP